MRTLDLIECAAFLKIDRTTALALAGRGDLPGAKVGRAWVFLEDELAEWLRQQIAAQRRQRQAEATQYATIPLDSPTSVRPLARRSRRRPLPELPDLKSIEAMSGTAATSTITSVAASIVRGERR